MNVAYLMKAERDFDKIVPPEFDYCVVSAGPDRTWEAETLGNLEEVEALLVWSEPVTEEVIRAAPRLKIVQRLGVGYDVLHGCLSITKELGIPCCNLEGVNKEAVAEHGILMMLALARDLLRMHEHARHARWPRLLSPEASTFELVGKTLGIVGLGATGVELARRARAFGMRIIYNDIRNIDASIVTELDATFMEKDHLYSAADVISINVDLNPTTRGLIGGRELELMKRKAILICCARGGIVDQHALRHALDSERIYGAGIDVFDPEPLRPDNPLLLAKNIVLTPHVAGVNGDTVRRHYAWSHENVKRVLLHGERPRWIVNGL